MAQRLANDWKAGTRRSLPRPEGATKVVQTKILNARAFENPSPGGLRLHGMATLTAAREHPRGIGISLALFEDSDGARSQDHHLRSTMCRDRNGPGFPFPVDLRPAHLLHVRSTGAGEQADQNVVADGFV